MDNPTIADLRADVEAADAEVARLKAEHSALRKEIARLTDELRAAERLSGEMFDPWSRTGRIPDAERKAATARAALLNAGRPTLPMVPLYSSVGTIVRVEHLGPQQMRTNLGTFRRQADGSWTCSHAGTIAPFDEAAVRAAVKAAAQGARDGGGE